MGSLAVILSLCTVVAVGIVYFFTDNIILSLLVLAVGLALAFYLDKKWRLDEAKDRVKDADVENRKRILESFNKLKDYKEQIDRQHQGVMSSAVDNIYDTSNHILHDNSIDLKFVQQVGLYIPRINKILDTYLLKSADTVFKSQSQEFMVRTSDVFTKLLTASGSQDVKEAESLMQALEETYRQHGFSSKDDGGNLS
ncbi:hypothetical protein [Lacrimispora sp.]|jgi:uncharacterized membrane protein|uniref:hypothetical protein n=1 Tax=Lacrimispora sp. TaxID=2719234 RepID=UPI00289C8716|nr:hypothetical protein [Lacrimispora sp.]